MNIKRSYLTVILIVLSVFNSPLYGQEARHFNYKLRYDFLNSPVVFKSLDAKLLGVEHRLSFHISKEFNKFFLSAAAGLGVRNGMGEVINSASLYDKYKFNRFYTPYSRMTHKTTFISGYLGRKLPYNMHISIGLEYYYYIKLNHQHTVPLDSFQGANSTNTLLEIEKIIKKMFLLSFRYSIDNYYLIKFNSHGKNNKYGIGLALKW